MRRWIFLSAIVAVASVFGVIFSDTHAAPSDLSHTLGRILLDVETNGEAWYVSPVDARRHYLGRPEDALAVMRRLALGISKENLARLPTAGDGWAGDAALRSRLSGRILLSVEEAGEAWYVNPVDQRRYRLGRPHEAFNVMRTLGLGVTAKNLSHFEIGVEVGNEHIDDVPFIAQAPSGKWGDLRQQEGCEEASVLMAVAWGRGLSVSAAEAEQSIIEMSEYQRLKYGHFVDTSGLDTMHRLLLGYHGYIHTDWHQNTDVYDVINALARGEIVLLPVNGKKLENPNFTAGGPLRHMIVIFAYDEANGEFITHEPGTRLGGHWRYSFATIRDAMNDYTSGTYAPLPQPPTTSMVTVRQNPV
jgi:hypothetical protein